MYTHIYIYICMCIHTHMCVCVCVYTCILSLHTYRLTHTLRPLRARDLEAVRPPVASLVEVRHGMVAQEDAALDFWALLGSSGET